MNKLFLIAISAIILSSCVTQKKYAELESTHNQAKQDLVDAKANLQQCLIEKDVNQNKVESLEAKVADLREDKKHAVQQVENLTVLTQASSDNIKNVISQLSEKDKYINGIRSAMTQKDSINLAIKYQLTKELSAGIQDEDIQIDVEKTVVYITIADKLLFKSGSSQVSERAKEILGKVATVISSRKGTEVMVEGYTDDVPINRKDIRDNWDLSVRRATSVVRVLQDDHGVNPERLIAAGRGEYSPLQSNDTSAGRSANRRTRIVILPRLEEFFEILEQKPE